MSRKRRAGIAQLVEQATENRRVPSSNLGPGISRNTYEGMLKHHIRCFCVLPSDASTKSTFAESVGEQ